MAIPILLNRFYGSVHTRFFVAARHLYDEGNRLDLTMQIPGDYLEEAAAHIIRAWERYGAAVDKDGDLAFSTNAYVAHYVTLKSTGGLGGRSFVQYLSGLGATPSVLGRDFRSARNQLKRHLGEMFARYSIRACYSSRPDQVVLAAAESDIAYATKHLGRPRVAVTARHDANTLAHIREASSASPNYHALITWDRALLSIDDGASAWGVLDPAAAVDLLSVAAERSSTRSLISPMIVAMSLSEEGAERGARIIDWFADGRILNLNDADQVDEALRFKASFLRSAKQVRTEILQEAWEKWRTARAD